MIRIQIKEIKKIGHYLINCNNSLFANITVNLFYNLNICIVNVAIIH